MAPRIKSLVQEIVHCIPACIVVHLIMEVLL